MSWLEADAELLPPPPLPLPSPLLSAPKSLGWRRLTTRVAQMGQEGEEVDEDESLDSELWSSEGGAIWSERKKQQIQEARKVLMRPSMLAALMVFCGVGGESEAEEMEGQLRGSFKYCPRQTLCGHGAEPQELQR